MTIFDFLLRLIEEYPLFMACAVLFIGIPYGILLWPLISPTWQQQRKLSAEAHESVPDITARLEHIKGEIEILRREGPTKVVTQLDEIVRQLGHIQHIIFEKTD